MSIAKDSTARAAAGWRAPKVIAEDTFDRGTCGWTQLVEGVHGTGPMVLDSEITYGESRHSLLFMTGEHSFSSHKPWGNASGIKRLSRGPSVGKVLATWKFAYGGPRSGDTSAHPRNIDFGIDQATPEGLRRFFKARWLNYDETTSTRVSEMRIDVAKQGGGREYITVPVGPAGDAKVALGVNENKRNLWTVELAVDVDAGVYDGLRVNGKGWGSLAPVPDNSLRAYGPEPHNLAQFASGFNACFEVCNRIETDASTAWANLAYFRFEEL